MAAARFTQDAMSSGQAGSAEAWLTLCAGCCAGFQAFSLYSRSPKLGTAVGLET